jgi:uncharacterized protein with GYD domain
MAVNYNDINDAKKRVEDMKKRSDALMQKGVKNDEKIRNLDEVMRIYDMLSTVKAEDNNALLSAMVLHLARENEVNPNILTLMNILL